MPSRLKTRPRSPRRLDQRSQFDGYPSIGDEITDESDIRRGRFGHKNTARSPQRRASVMSAARSTSPMIVRGELMRTKVDTASLCIAEMRNDVIARGHPFDVGEPHLRGR